MATPAHNIRRKLPGHAWRDTNDEVVFLKGVVNYSSSRVQWIETESKIHPLVYLIADSYAYYCEHCHSMMFEQEVMQMGVRICIFCRGSIRPLVRGEKVRVHYRFGRDGKWGGWWAEKWEW